MKILIAGGAGYIGSTISSKLIDSGHTPVILDDLSTGKLEFVRNRIFYKGDIADKKILDLIFHDHPDIEIVVLCAALIDVSESVAEPVMYYQSNVVKSLEFVSHLLEFNCKKLIFSSSASIYSGSDVLDEYTTVRPSSPYGNTKAICEIMLNDIVKSTDLRVLSLRYFNPIGCDPYFRTGLQLKYSSSVLGRMMYAMESSTDFLVTGADFSTRDGSGVRDYIHVWDLAEAHLSAIERFDDSLFSHSTYEVINLGDGSGVTVFELLEVFNRLSTKKITVKVGPRRPGDVAGGFTDITKAARLLGWRPGYTLSDAVAHSLTWHSIRSKIIDGNL